MDDESRPLLSESAPSAPPLVPVSYESVQAGSNYREAGIMLVLLGAWLRSCATVSWAVWLKYAGTFNCRTKGTELCTETVIRLYRN